MIDIACVGPVGSARRCHALVDQTLGGAWCPQHRPVDLTRIEVVASPVRGRRAAPRPRLTYADVANGLRAAGGDMSEAGRRLAVSPQAIQKWVATRPGLAEIRSIALARRSP